MRLCLRDIRPSFLKYNSKTTAIPEIIPVVLICTAGIISAGQMHPQLALFFHRDDFAPVGCVPSLRTSLPGHSVNLRKTPESMFFNLSYATPDALRKQSFLRLSAAFAAYSPSHNGAFVSKAPTAPYARSVRGSLLTRDIRTIVSTFAVFGNWLTLIPRTGT